MPFMLGSEQDDWADPD